MADGQDDTVNEAYKPRAGFMRGRRGLAGLLLLLVILAAVGAVNGAFSEPVREPDEETEKDDSFTETASRDGSLDATGNRTDVEWSSIWARAQEAGTHINLNQPAKREDAVLDRVDWTLVFHLDAPFRDLDAVYLCGPSATVALELYDEARDAMLFDGQVRGVPRCA